MILHIDPAGTVHTIYSEAIDLGTLGALGIRRASFVEPDAVGCWWVDLAPVRGPRLGPYPRRSEALCGEHAWLTQHWLPALASLPG